MATVVTRSPMRDAAGTTVAWVRVRVRADESTVMPVVTASVAQLTVATTTGTRSRTPHHLRVCPSMVVSAAQQVLPLVQEDEGEAWSGT